jgi:hypothetical protein
MTDDEQRVADLIRAAFRGVRLGNGVGLRQGNGLDDYADAATLAEYRSEDEKGDWSKIPTEDLKRFYCGLSFFDPEGMRFHLPAYLTADLEEAVNIGILFHLIYFGDQAMSRFDLLSDSQRHAVREYLLFRLAQARACHDEFNQPMIEKALAEYWTDSADQHPAN